MSSKDTEQDILPTEIPEDLVIKGDTRSGIIGYFAHNPVAANLLMCFVIAMGLVSYITIQRQMFPNFELDKISIQAIYPGASPQEIEEGVLVKIEEALKDVTEIDRLVSEAYRDRGHVMIDVEVGADLAETLDKVKLRVDSIATFPAGLEPLTVYQIEFRQEVIDMALVGDLSMQELKPMALRLEDEILALDEVSLLEVISPKDEISIELDPQMLRQYGLTLSDVSAAISAHSTNASIGQVRTQGGVISVRVENQYYSGTEFREIPVKIGRGGSRVFLGDVATIRDAFVEGEHYFRYSGQNAIYFSVKATTEQNMVTVASAVNKWMAERNKTLPESMELRTLVDMTFYLNGRLNMMKKNLFIGAVLVAITLSLFLRFRLAFWVMVGLPVCFLGAVMLMPLFGVTINVVSLFGFIMVLGIVVDDAIVIGESAYSEIEKNGSGTHSVVVGARRVATPATFGVLTTIAVFAPFLFTTGMEGTFFVNISTVVILCLIFSLIESKLILPAHLSGVNFSRSASGGWRDRFNTRYQHFINHYYRNFLERCLAQRWLVLSLFSGLLIITLALVSASLVRFIPTPPVPHDFPSIHITMNKNVSDTATIDALKSIEKMVMQVEREMIERHGQGMIRDRLVFNQERDKGLILMALVDEDKRNYDAYDLSRIWRERMPDIAGIRSIRILDDVNDNPESDGEFGYLMLGQDQSMLNSAGRKFMQLLGIEEGLFDISSSIDPVGKEIQLRLLPVAYDLGFSLADIARQVGLGFYGGEVQRLIRNGEEIKVMVRYPELTRQTLSSLKYTVLTTPGGQEVMLGDVAELLERPGINFIRREEGQPSVYVYGAIDEQSVEPSRVADSIEKNVLPTMQKRFPDVEIELGGDLAEQREQSSEQILFFVAGLLIVYILLAVPLKSYVQPLIIMSVIPFGLTGAVWGHFAFGMDLSLMSTFGIIAAAGVVINDSLVMTDCVNQLRSMGLSTVRAVVDAGCARFRPITLTSVTTFAGVMPIMLESSLQARFVIPMAVSLGCAVLFATFITLILVPCLYMILQDVGRIFVKRGASEARGTIGLRGS